MAADLSRTKRALPHFDLAVLEAYQQSNALGNRTTYTYNAAGLITSSTDPLKNVPNYDYNSLTDLTGVILFLTAFVLTLFGTAESWLSGPEIALSLGLLAISYFTGAYEMSMASHARFVAIVVPGYFVLGLSFSAARSG